MIQLICSNCGQVMQVDDGFAGGVCRCSRCAAIQTVPRASSGGATSPANLSGKTIYQKKSRLGPDDLAVLSDVVSSSGLAGSGLSSRSGRRSSVAPPSRGLLYALIGGGALALLIGAILTVTVLLPAKPTPPPEAAPQTVTAPSPGHAPGAAPALIRAEGPAFATIPLPGDRPVVYLLDRGDATAEFLPDLINATLASARSLGPGRRFQVVLWAIDGHTVTAPSSPSPATPQFLGVAQEQLARAGDSGASDLLPALDIALAAQAADVVLMTGKTSQQIDSDTVAAVSERLHKQASPPRLHTVQIVQAGEAPEFDSPLQRMATQAKGTALRLEAGQLSQLTR